MVGMRGLLLAVVGCLTFHAVAGPVLAQVSVRPESVIGLGWLQQAELDPSARLLGTCSDTALHLWRLNGSLVSVLPAIGGVPWAGFSWSPDGSMIAISNLRGCITVARIPDLSVIAEIGPANYSFPFFPYSPNTHILPRRIRWSPNGSRLAYGWWSGTVDIFDVKTQRLVTSLDQTDFSTPSAHALFPCEADLDWSPRRDQILRTGDHGELLVFNASSGRGLFKLGEVSEQGSVAGCTANPGVLSAFSPDGSMIATWRRRGSPSLELYDAASGGLVASTSIDAFVESLAWSPSGELIALGTYGGSILLLRVRDRQLVSNTSGHQWSVVSLSWKGSVLASASEDRTVKLWDVRADGSVSPIRTFTGWSSAPVETISWYPDGERIAVTYRGGGSIRVLTTDGSEELRAEPQLEEWAALGCVSPDGRMIASITWSGEVTISQDGRITGSFTRSGEVYIWDARLGTLVNRLYTGQDVLVDLCWSPVWPGVLAVAGWDGFEVWNVLDVEPEGNRLLRERLI